MGLRTSDSVKLNLTQFFFLAQRVPLLADHLDQAALRIQDRVLDARPGRQRLDRQGEAAAMLN